MSHGISLRSTNHISPFSPPVVKLLPWTLTSTHFLRHVLHLEAMSKSVSKFWNQTGMEQLVNSVHGRLYVATTWFESPCFPLVYLRVDQVLTIWAGVIIWELAGHTIGGTAKAREFLHSRIDFPLLCCRSHASQAVFQELWCGKWWQEGGGPVVNESVGCRRRRLGSTGHFATTPRM
jgi:hypothetical protein